MKYFVITLMAMICIASSFWGCQKEDLGNLDGIFSDTTQAGPVSEMTASIKGIPWEASSYDITLTPGTPGQIVITGQADNGQIINLVVSNSKAGDYLLNVLSPHLGTYSPDTTNTILYKSNASKTTGGVINIDTIDTAKGVMTGEFNFIGGLSNGSMVNITDGVFRNLGYENTAKNVEFGANVNGSSWSPNSVTTSDNAATNVLTITAINANGQKMTLGFPASTAPRSLAYVLSPNGTYQASFIDDGVTLVPAPLDSNNKKPSKLSCVVKITSNTTTSSPRNVKGTFNFYAAPSGNLNAKGVRIAAGQFNVNY